MTTEEYVAKKKEEIQAIIEKYYCSGEADKISLDGGGIDWSLWASIERTIEYLKLHKSTDNESESDNFIYKVLKSMEVILYSIYLDAGIGAARGFKLNGTVIGGEILVNDQVYSLKVDASDGQIAIGVSEGSSSGFSIMGATVLGVSEETFRDYRCSVDSEGNITHANMCMCDTDANSEVVHKFSLGIGGYLGVGLAAEIGWDIDEIVEKLMKIWQ